MITNTHLRKQLSSSRRMLKLFQRKVEEGQISADHPQIAIYEAEIVSLATRVSERENSRPTQAGR